ncbi:hypothetical protein HU200_019147 [Digitaria exilis]|uniref:Protein kinase domain-containing protein n=1 Tax=Digitaria exilis TaxID=1010633 RepID=A0A835F2V7_9POAL|nr:hypothetical protein HU200_019147 [Digitaria exilis]
MDASSYFVLALLTLHSVSAMSGCSGALDLPAAQLSHRRLLQDTNLAARSEANFHLPIAAHVPPSGTFLPSGSQTERNHHEEVPPPPPADPPQSQSKPHDLLRSMRWLYVIVLPAISLLLLAGLACWLLPCRERAVATIGPWKTGLSGQLQKAFVTGVPKLQRSELERACEEFSNIIANYPHYTVYKGTLSSGVEIAVVSTMITSSKDWSEHSESCFRKKVNGILAHYMNSPIFCVSHINMKLYISFMDQQIDSLSRINHKNFINLLGFCEEEEPFTRMMVFEYAPNGTLYESLHAEDFEHIGWRGRMRIIMGLAYCIQHMHELDPPVVHPDLQSSSILLSEDCAAKIADMSVWHEVISKGKTPTSGELDRHNEQMPDGLAGNVYSFGVLLLEIISGKLPDPAQERPLVSLALECINNGDRSMASLLDLTLKDTKEDDLETISRVIHACIQRDPRNRPSMREITGRLREAIGISPVAATPRLSPLWWAELEVLSTAEAS